mmetsp:Transcript_51331/g.135627  ORF Transcript_51331/g.135627 Transcript_51331/m.135627 type:complete len:242 (-) Transcript_51331:330-1055(-)
MPHGTRAGRKSVPYVAPAPEKPVGHADACKPVCMRALRTPIKTSRRDGPPGGRRPTASFGRRCVSRSQRRQAALGKITRKRRLQGEPWRGPAQPVAQPILRAQREQRPSRGLRAWRIHKTYATHRRLTDAAPALGLELLVVQRPQMAERPLGGPDRSDGLHLRGESQEGVLDLPILDILLRRDEGVLEERGAELVLAAAADLARLRAAALLGAGGGPERGAPGARSDQAGDLVARGTAGQA